MAYPGEMEEIKNDYFVALNKLKNLVISLHSRLIVLTNVIY